MKLKVFGDIVPVTREKELINAGEYHIYEKKIVIQSDLTGDKYTETLLHELFEAVYFRCSFYQSLHNDLKEVIIDCFSKAIVENFDVKPKRHTK